MQFELSRPAFPYPCVRLRIQMLEKYSPRRASKSDRTLILMFRFYVTANYDRHLAPAASDNDVW
jgi:hypothetical protein